MLDHRSRRAGQLRGQHRLSLQRRRRPGPDQRRQHVNPARRHHLVAHPLRDRRGIGNPRPLRRQPPQHRQQAPEGRGGVRVAAPVRPAHGRRLQPHLRRWQPGLNEDPEEPAAGPDARPAWRRPRRHHPRRTGGDRWCRRHRPRRRTHVGFVECDEAARLQQPGHVAHDRHRIGEIHQHPAPDDCVEPRLQRQRLQRAGPEPNVAPPRRRHPAACHLEDRRVHVDPKHPPPRPHNLGEEQSHVAGAAAEIQHRHARADPRGLEHAAGDRAVDLVLEDQPRGLRVTSAQDVVVVRHPRTPTPSAGIIQGPPPPIPHRAPCRAAAARSASSTPGAAAAAPTPARHGPAPPPRPPQLRPPRPRVR